MKRYFIIDPVCVYNYGHNHTLIEYYENYLNEMGHSVTSFVSRHFNTSKPSKSIPIFRHYYYKEMPLKERFSISNEFEEIDKENEHTDFVESAATNDVKKIFKDYEICSEDTIIMPGADFYSIIACCNIIEELKPELRPSLLVRFIGVMEGASSYHDKPIDHLIKRLKNLISSYSSYAYKLKFGTETNSYSKFLSNKLESYVEWLPYPSIDLKNECSIKEKIKYIFFPGAGRMDKGFLSIKEIAKKSLQKPELNNLIFVCQSISPIDSISFNQEILQLYSLPNVLILPHIIDKNKMDYFYQNCLCVILPYDRTTYEMRGSAALMEANAFKKPVITYSNLGFSDIVDFFRLGYCCDSIDEMIDKILFVTSQKKYFGSTHHDICDSFSKLCGTITKNWIK